MSCPKIEGILFKGHAITLSLPPELLLQNCNSMQYRLLPQRHSIYLSILARNFQQSKALNGINLFASIQGTLNRRNKKPDEIPKRIKPNTRPYTLEVPIYLFNFLCRLN